MNWRNAIAAALGQLALAFLRLAPPNMGRLLQSFPDIR